MLRKLHFKRPISQLLRFLKLQRCILSVGPNQGFSILTWSNFLTLQAGGTVDHLLVVLFSPFFVLLLLFRRFFFVFVYVYSLPFCSPIVFAIFIRRDLFRHLFFRQFCSPCFFSPGCCSPFVFASFFSPGFVSPVFVFWLGLGFRVGG